MWNGLLSARFNGFHVGRSLRCLLFERYGQRCARGRLGHKRWSHRCHQCEACVERSYLYTAGALP